jgi:mRNA-degrading endonuclease RelE of RelBE toxin-antitoxin system
MRLQYTRRFQRAYIRLTDEDAEQVKKTLQLMAENLRHPSLHVKKIRGVDNIWEARAGLAIRLTFEIQGDVMILRNVGLHDKTLKRP